VLLWGTLGLYTGWSSVAVWHRDDRRPDHPGDLHGNQPGELGQIIVGKQSDKLASTTWSRRPRRA
jgi:hypothetical protein